MGSRVQFPEAEGILILPACWDTDGVHPVAKRVNRKTRGFFSGVYWAAEKNVKYKNSFTWRDNSQEVINLVFKKLSTGMSKPIGQL